MTSVFQRIIIIVLLTFFALAPLAAQQTATDSTAQPATVTPATTTTTTVVANVDSAETRNQLRELLDRLPPQVGKTLKLDPTLWTNQPYLANYPTLGAFAASHPEVAHSPAYYLESVWIPSDPAPEPASYRMWNNLMETLSIFGAMLTFGGIFIWLIKTIIDHRRWNRLSRVQAEVHNKLLDRFANNDDLLRYIETPAGRHFLESAPIALEASPKSISAPIGRVLWSVQIGIVLVAAGFGMRLVSWNVDKDVAQPLTALGILGMAIGGGFIVAAGASYILSRRLGLWQPPAVETSVSE
jgi:hypothetical protein